jgi:hypothetical protein
LVEDSTNSASGTFTNISNRRSFRGRTLRKDCHRESREQVQGSDSSPCTRWFSPVLRPYHSDTPTHRGQNAILLDSICAAAKSDLRTLGRLEFHAEKTTCLISNRLVPGVGLLRVGRLQPKFTRVQEATIVMKSRGT